MVGKEQSAWQSESCNCDPAKGWDVLDHTAVMGMKKEGELGVSSTPLVAATLGHQPAIPIIRRNQSHSTEAQIKLMPSNGWGA